MKHDSLSELRQLLDERCGPGLAKVAPPDARVLCEERAAALFDVALTESGWSNREFSRRYRVDERVVRDYRSGERRVPLGAILALPRNAQERFLRAMLTRPADQWEGIPLPAEEDVA